MKHVKTFDKFSAVSIQGEMLHVGDADAIILTLRKQQETLLIVLDGGDASTQTKVLDHVRSTCRALQKDGPDLLICSHYDSDHIAGLVALSEHFGNKIKELWMHQPANVIRDSRHLLTEISEHNNTGRPLSSAALFLNNLRLLSNDPNGRFNLLLESIKQANDLISLAEVTKIRLKEPFMGECSLASWPEIKILGPTRPYFDSLFGQSTIAELVGSEYGILLNEGNRTVTRRPGDPCESLEISPTTSAVNRASVILRIDIGSKKLLFTGDAGVQSFQSADGFPESVKDMTFLKIPHHGSRHNITKSLIDTINPAMAYNSGYSFEDPDVMGCLTSKRERIVKSTGDGDDLTFSFEA
jgi:beta-lactamase superfamily II metal-dependent hydrolase